MDWYNLRITVELIFPTNKQSNLDVVTQFPHGGPACLKDVQCYISTAGQRNVLTILALLGCMLMSFLFPSYAYSQTVATYTDVRKSIRLTQLSSGPTGWYATPQAAWEVYSNYSNWTTGPITNRVFNFRHCETQSYYYWGIGSDWCHDYETTNNGRIYNAGTTSVISTPEGCPNGFMMVNSAPLSGRGADSDPYFFERRCEKTVRAFHPLAACTIGNPIRPDDGSKLQIDIDYIDPSGQLTFKRTYNSSRGTFSHSFEADFLPPIKGASASCTAMNDTLWDSSVGNYITLPVCAVSLNPDENRAIYTTTEGYRYEFSVNATSASPVLAYNKDRLKQNSTSGAGWLLSRPDESRMMVFNATGRLESIVATDGKRVGLTYSSSPIPGVAPGIGYLTTVSDNFDRKIYFQYNQEGSMVRFLDPAGQAINYDQTPAPEIIDNNLSKTFKPIRVTYQDGSSIAYLWDEAASITGSADRRNLLTGIADQNGIRYATFAYANGVASSTEHAGGVDRFTVTDNRSNGQGDIAISEPFGATRLWTFSLVNGFSRLNHVSQPAGSGCSASTSAMTYDANGNLASADDFNAHRACYVSDLTRNLETTRVEGLPNTQACSTVTPPNTAIPAPSRKTSTQWHPDWRLPSKVAEPGKVTTSVYNGQPDPFNASAIASCAPMTALLPDGNPIVVLCRQVEQATTDVDGHLGFTAALQAGVPNREQKWTYNQFGQVLTHDGPRTDVTDTTTYAYYADTTADHTRGDLQRMTNALGQVTNYTKYNKHGQLLQSTDPNGVTTTHMYDLRQRLLSTSVAAQTTSFSYDPVGQLKRVTQPDASWIGYGYDAAHRLVAVTDNAGNRIEFTLDNAGNRIAENTKDPSGTLKRALSRSLDALGRVQQTTGRE